MAGKIKVIDKVDQQDFEDISLEEREDYFSKLMMGKEVTTEIETTKGTFVVKYPNVEDEISIGKWMAWYRNYNPIESFDLNTNNIIAITATLDCLVISGPGWFDRAKKSVRNFRWNRVPDQKLARELYNKIQTFRTEIEESFDQNRGASTQRLPPATNPHETVGGDIFEGLSD